MYWFGGSIRDNLSAPTKVNIVLIKECLSFLLGLLTFEARRSIYRVPLCAVYFQLFCVFYFRKKKKDKEKKKLGEQQIRQSQTSQNTEEEETKTYVDKRTPAQMAFDKIQEKRVSMLKQAMAVPFVVNFSLSMLIQCKRGLGCSTFFS